MQRAEVVRKLSEELATQRGPLLPVLHEIMQRYGWIDTEQDVPVVADVLNLSRAEVFGVISFYHDFQTAPPPAHLIRICRGEACQAIGGEDLWAARENWQSPQVAVQEVFCLGNCALGPSAVIDNNLLGRMNTEHLDEVVSGWES